MKQLQLSWHTIAIVLLLLLITTVQAPTASAQTNQQQKAARYTVSNISFSGLRTISENQLLNSLPLKKGDTVSIPGTEIPGAIEYLWAQKKFSDIQAEQDIAGNMIDLRFVLNELPLLDSVVFEGNDKLKDKELEKIAALYPGRHIDEQSLLTAASKIQETYKEKGYLRAEIGYSLKQLENGRVTALFSIDEKSKVIIEKIRFHGNDAFKDGKLRGVFEETSQNAWWKTIFGQPKLDTEKYNQDKKLLVDFYRENGYRDMTIVRDSISYTKDQKGLNIDIFLEEGPVYYIRDVTWNGNTKDFATTDILTTVFDIKRGDRYNATKIQEQLNFSKDNRDVASLYLDRGYLAFRSSLQEQVVPPDSVDLNISLFEGDQFRLGKINIEGNTKTKDHVIRRELRTVPGDMFSRQKVVRSVREISMLNYFDPESTRPDIQPDEASKTVDITYNVTEKQTDTFNASVGYSGNIGFTGALGVTFNNFSLQDLFNGEAWDPLPHGDGQKLSFQWQFGNEDYRTLSLSFTEPWAFGTPTALGFSVFATKRNYTDDGDDDNLLEQTGASLNIGRRLSWPDDYFSINWKLKYLHSEGELLSFVDSQNQPDTADEVSITQTIARNSIDNPIYPRRGSNNSLSTQLAGGLLPGTVDFYKFIASSSWYVPLGGDFVLNLSTQHGYLDTFSEGDYIPYTDSFYMGGSGLSSLSTVPLRGYDDRALGELNDDTGLYTGRVYSKFTTELRYPLTLSPTASVYALAFVEAGNLWGSVEDMDYSDLKRSAGLGLRLYLPIIGLVGLDYGYGFDPVASNPGADNQGWKFIFSFGQFAQ
ncbi:outer membrane protein assembly factor BamA [Prosthecochloris sp. SCSIO W1101]|uniref:outer membrane protein assembly factor BamA n=1 Tax=Prosthecochloris sp. SCSIO W1101 TaxID=2992242 RepID=UPI00223D73AD|nr:outer membrane protein assembly factor BamA [Prosthecochloris sp. SCSIO W1101]UZJ41050.1 outer membrane protein assembly factor BamA [Prosthecochloris sp. SCSIO W1101]